MAKPMPDHGLTPEQVRLIIAMLHPYAHQIERVGLFGSRATGRYRPNSDIDLVLYGSLDEATISRLWTLFAESSLPVKVDVLRYNPEMYPPLKAHIDDEGVPFLTQADLLNTGVSP
jgi:uncharacterized protein